MDEDAFLDSWMESRMMGEDGLYGNPLDDFDTRDDEFFDDEWGDD